MGTLSISQVRASWRRHVSRNRFDSFRSDVKSVSSSTSGGTRTGHQGHHTPTEVFPKSILKPSDSSCSNLPPHSRVTILIKHTTSYNNAFIGDTQILVIDILTRGILIANNIASVPCS